MHLSKFTLENFRRFRNKDNEVFFAKNLNGKNLNGSTLIIGQNNSGKTSIVSALKKSTGNEPFLISDFNFDYLAELLSYFSANIDKIKSLFIDYVDTYESERDNILSNIIPFMKFCFSFSLNYTDCNSEELLTNIAPLITNDLKENELVNVFVTYRVKETTNYISNLYEEFQNGLTVGNFNEFIEFLENNVDFETNYYLDEKCEDKVPTFSIKNLVNVNVISFEKLHSSGRLSAAFNKIYNYKASQSYEIKEKMTQQVKNINNRIDENIDLSKELTLKVNEAVGKAFDNNHVTMELKANLTVESLLKNVIKYQYKDGSYDIPEDQFGMGYTNLMLIIAEIIDYLDDSPKTLFANTINLIVIEEPESYMHPQMQKLFIKHLNDVVMNLIGDKAKINCQLLITSHSPNIMFGKIDSEDTFDNIDYINYSNGHSSVVKCLNDNDIIPSTNSENGISREEQFKFLKKQIKYNCCDLFFADAGLIVEGLAEEILLPYFLELDSRLNKRYVCVLSVNGAFAHIYKKLFKALGIPISIITDIDISGTATCEDQVADLTDKTTTNSILNNFKFIIGKDFSKIDGNIGVFTQAKTNNFYPTSLEEAIILSNAESNALRTALQRTLPVVFNEYKDDLVNKSHLLQLKIGNNSKKGDFATNLLFSLINKSENDAFTIPGYIAEAFNFIHKHLNDVGGDNDAK